MDMGLLVLSAPQRNYWKLIGRLMHYHQHDFYIIIRIIGDSGDNCGDSITTPNATMTTMPLRLVLDTNIVMDMLHFANPHTLPLQTAIRNSLIQCYCDTECLAELERVTGYPEFKLDRSARSDLMERYRQIVILCNANTEEDYLLPRCRDKDDQKFLILAARCNANLLITRDKLLLKLAHHRHSPPPFSILTAEAACKSLQLVPEHPTKIA